ncbi:hypothetical protein Tco_0312180 [Tanacetum coccineum]
MLNESIILQKHGYLAVELHNILEERSNQLLTEIEGARSCIKVARWLEVDRNLLNESHIKARIVKAQQNGLVKKQNSVEAVKGEKQSQPLKKDGESSKPKYKRKASLERNSIAPPDLRQGSQGDSSNQNHGVRLPSPLQYANEDGLTEVNQDQEVVIIGSIGTKRGCKDVTH